MGGVYRYDGTFAGFLTLMALLLPDRILPDAIQIELPQQQAANLATLERLNAQLRLNSDNQLRAMERRERLLKHLADLDPAGSAGGPDATATRIGRLKQELTELRTRFSDKYPDVVRVKAEIAALERQLAEAKPDATPGTMPAPPDDQPLHRLREALKTVEAGVEGVPQH